MSDYYKVFQERSARYGKSFKQTVFNRAVIEFETFLKSSPNAVDVNINNSDKETKVATIFSRDKNDTVSRRFFLARKEDQVQVGDLIYWNNSIWLMLRKELETVDVYDKFEALECRHSIKWVDDYGILKEVPCYLVAQTDEKIKTNFRSWNGMITPQPNKYLEIITQRTDIKKGQKFLIEDTAWLVVESDYISVKNVLYLSLTEDKVDRYTDDIENSIADITNLNKYQIEVVNNNLELGIGDTYQVDANVLLNGNIRDEEIALQLIEGEDLVEIDEDFVVTALAEGTVRIRVSMGKNSEVFTDIEMQILAAAPEILNFIIEGDQTVKWGRTKTYSLIKVENGQKELVDGTFEIVSGIELLSNYKIKNSLIEITANTDNKIGQIEIKVTYDNNGNEEYIYRVIDIISTWM